MVVGELVHGKVSVNSKHERAIKSLDTAARTMYLDKLHVLDWRRQMTLSLHGTIASLNTTWVFVYLLSTCTSSAILWSLWGVHASRVDAVEESWGVQLLREWACAHSGDMACRQHQLYPGRISPLLFKATPALWGSSGDCWLGFTMALRIELVLSTGQLAKDVWVLNRLPKTRIFKLAIVPCRESVICLLQFTTWSLARYLALAAGSGDFIAHSFFCTCS